MHLTPGERRAALCLIPIVTSFLPPVTSWAAGVDTLVFGLPFLVFWSATSIAMTAVWVTVAFYVKERIDGRSGD